MPFLDLRLSIWNHGGFFEFLKNGLKPLRMMARPERLELPTF